VQDFLEARSGNTNVSYTILLSERLLSEKVQVIDDH